MLVVITVVFLGLGCITRKEKSKTSRRGLLDVTFSSEKRQKFYI